MAPYSARSRRPINDLVIIRWKQPHRTADHWKDHRVIFHNTLTAQCGLSGPGSVLTFGKIVDIESNRLSHNVVTRAAILNENSLQSAFQSFVHLIPNWHAEKSTRILRGVSHVGIGKRFE